MELNMSGETIESLLYRDRKPVLELRISYPQVLGPLSRRSEYRFNDLYCRQARSLNKKARTEYYHKAAEAYRAATEQEYDFTLHSFVRTFSTARLERRYTSVVFDRYEYAGGAHGTTTRTANTWDFQRGETVPLTWFFLPGSDYKKILLQQILQQIGQQKEREEILFFERPEQNARQGFQERNYYLTHNSVAIYYPLYSLAPYYAGILTYKTPFKALEHCWIRERRPSETPPCTGAFAQRFGTELL